MYYHNYLQNSTKLLLLSASLPQLLPKQDILKRMSSLKTKMYRQHKPVEPDNCAICLEPFNNNQVSPHSQTQKHSGLMQDS